MLDILDHFGTAVHLGLTATPKETKDVSNTDNNAKKSNESYWQQHVDYTMDIDVNGYQYNGKQKLVYTNNSPDDLDKVFYHLYFNAFQPGSMMDVRSRTIQDPDGRVRNHVARQPQHHCRDRPQQRDFPVRPHGLAFQQPRADPGTGPGNHRSDAAVSSGPVATAANRTARPDTRP